MTALPFLIGLSLLFIAVGIVALFWAVDHDQFEDMDTPRLLPLTDAPDDAKPSDDNEPPRA